MKVKATNEFKKQNVKPKELDHIPEMGEEFEISEERFEVLNGRNNYKAIFVEKMEEDHTKNKVTTKKKTRKNSL